MKPYSHSLLFLEGTPSWYRRRIRAQRAWDLSEEHVCDPPGQMPVGSLVWPLTWAYPWINSRSHHFLIRPGKSTIWISQHCWERGALFPLVKVTQITKQGQSQSSAVTSWSPGFYPFHFSLFLGSHLPSTKTRLSLSLSKFGNALLAVPPDGLSSVLLRGSCLYDDSIYIFSG